MGWIEGRVKNGVRVKWGVKGWVYQIPQAGVVHKKWRPVRSSMSADNNQRQYRDLMFW